MNSVFSWAALLVPGIATLVRGALGALPIRGIGHGLFSHLLLFRSLNFSGVETRDCLQQLLFSRFGIRWSPSMSFAIRLATVEALSAEGEQT